MKQARLETIVGFIVIAIAFSFFVFAYNVSNLSKGKSGGYVLTADFQDIDGITEGSDVKLAGIKIGQIEKIALNDDLYYASVKLLIDQTIHIPVDSRATVSTNGLLGGKYIRIIPGGSNDNFANGDKIKLTQSAINIEDLIGKVVYSLTTNK